MTAPRVAIIGVPTSAGSHHAGQDLAPAAMRAHDFAGRLAAATGAEVDDLGDVAGAVFSVDHDEPAHRNLGVVLRVARAVADAVAGARRAGAVAVVLGGDCTITLGVVAGVQRHDPNAGLAYFDGDADLGTPAGTRSGVLDAMGIAHLLGIADTELARLDGESPILDDDHLVMLGYDEGDAETFDGGVLAARPQLRHVPDHELRADPAGIARQAVAALSSVAGSLVVHFDVDAVDSGDLPLGNFPHYGTGVRLEAAGDVLRELCAAPNLAAVVLTEVNPTHDPAGTQIARYVETVTRNLGAALRGLSSLPPESGQAGC
jgi:arginase